MEILINKKQKELDKLEKAYDKEKNIFKKKQLEGKIYDFKKKNFPKFFFESKNGKTYKHY